MGSLARRFAPALVLAAVALSPGQASAKRGIVLITTGETITHVGDVSGSSKLPANVNKVGYRYNYYGIFWIDFWTSDGTYCVYEGEQSRSITPSEAALLLGKKESDLSRPFLYRYPLGLLIVGGLAVLGILGAAIGGKAKPAEEKPADDGSA